MPERKPDDRERESGLRELAKAIDGAPEKLSKELQLAEKAYKVGLQKGIEYGAGAGVVGGIVLAVVIERLLQWAKK
jgi:hypothetical protein